MSNARVLGGIMQQLDNLLMGVPTPCKHENKTYQPREWDTNIPESYTCDDCGADLDIPEPDWDALVKEDNL